MYEWMCTWITCGCVYLRCSPLHMKHSQRPVGILVVVVVWWWWCGGTWGARLCRLHTPSGRLVSWWRRHRTCGSRGHSGHKTTSSPNHKIFRAFQQIYTDNYIIKHWIWLANSNHLIYKGTDQSPKVLVPRWRDLCTLRTSCTPCTASRTCWCAESFRQ